MTKDEALKLALEALNRNDYLGWQTNIHVRQAIKEALAQPEQEPNKDGSPCSEFWDWLPKAYNFEGDGNFTKYNMEVAFLAGKQAAQPEQEPVAWANLNALSEQINSVNCGTVYRLPSEAEGRQPLYTTPPQRKPLEGVIDVRPIGYHSLQLIFRSQTDIAEFKTAHGVKE